MPSMAGSKGGITKELKSKLMMLRKKNVQKPKCQSQSQCDRPVKTDLKEQCNG